MRGSSTGCPLSVGGSGGTLERQGAASRLCNNGWGGNLQARLGPAWVGINRYSRLHHHRETANINAGTSKVFGGQHGNKGDSGPDRKTRPPNLFQSRIYNGHALGTVCTAD